MPLPTVKDLRPVNPVLTNLSLGFRNPAFFYDKLFPPVEVPERSGTYFIWTRDYWFRRATGGIRAAGGPYNRLGFGVETATYATLEYGWEELVDDVTKASSQAPGPGLDQVAVEHLSNTMQLELEKQAAADGFVTGVWGTSTALTGVNQWSDYDASNPIANADTAKRTIRRNTGNEPDNLLMGALTWEILKEHPLLLDKYKYTQSGILTEALVGAALGINVLMVGKSVENTAAEKAPGTASFTGADIWTDNALFLKVTPTPGLMVPNGAYRMVWNERNNVPWAVESYREESHRSDVHRIFSHWDNVIVGAQYGYMYLDTNA